MVLLKFFTFTDYQSSYYIFTFQYGLIKIALVNKTIAGAKVNLHSSMVLLKFLKMTELSNYALTIYIPVWSY